MGEVSGQAPIRHIIVIDEAPQVIQSNVRVEGELVRILQEARKFGLGIVLVCRNPGISEDILRETNQKISHKLALPKDISLVARMMGLQDEEKNLISRLPSGLAFACISGKPTVGARIHRI